MTKTHQSTPLHIRALSLYDVVLTFLPIGCEHSKHIPSGAWTIEIFHCRSRLLHKVDKSGGCCQNYNEKDLLLLLEKDHV